MIRHFDDMEGERQLDEIRLLAETGYQHEARTLAENRLRETPDDLEVLGLTAQLLHRIGAISDAIDRWRRLREASMRGRSALLRLTILSQEEKDGTGPLRQDVPLVRRALRLAAQGRHDRALAACAQGQALATSAGDLDQRKLLALLGAILDELAGRLPEASTALEHLGADPALAHDADRLTLLARIYERRGDLQGKQRAERVLSFLAQGGSLSSFSRLIDLRRQLGDEAGVREAQAAYEDAFRRRMHWLTPRARLTAAVRRYIPTAQLGMLPLPDPDEVDQEVERGILWLVRGQAKRALSLLPAEACAWRAEALLDEGDTQSALEAAVDAVLQRGAPDEPLARLLAATLSSSAGTRSPKEAIELALAALRQSAGAKPAGPRSLRSLSLLEARVGHLEVAARLGSRALAAERRPWPPPGVVRAAAIYSLPGKAKGLVHDVIARRFPAEGSKRGRLLSSEIHGNLAQGVEVQLRRVFTSVREALVARFPEREEDFDRWAYGLHLTKDDEPSGGPSLELPVAVAFASILLHVPVPSHWVFSGALTYDGAGQLAVRQVGEIGLKLKATLHAGASCLVLPSQQREEVLSGQEVPPRIAARSILPVASLDEVLQALQMG